MPFDDDTLTFATPVPAPVSTVFTLLQPLTVAVWAAVGASFAVTSLAMWAVARGEEEAMATGLREWSQARRSAWYVFGTLIGESITRDTRSERANALRYLGIWAFSCSFRPSYVFFDSFKHDYFCGWTLSLNSSYYRSCHYE